MQFFFFSINKLLGFYTLLFLFDSAEICELKLLFGNLVSLMTEIWLVCAFSQEIFEPHKRLTYPVRRVREKHGNFFIAHVIRIILLDDIDDSFLFFAFNVYAVVCVEYPNLLIPKDAREDPITAVPTSRIV